MFATRPLRLVELLVTVAALHGGAGVAQNAPWLSVTHPVGIGTVPVAWAQFGPNPVTPALWTGKLVVPSPPHGCPPGSLDGAALGTISRAIVESIPTDPVGTLPPLLSPLNLPAHLRCPGMKEDAVFKGMSKIGRASCRERVFGRV